jgi:outer membrane biogenesis lipoprotein LolB
MTQYSVFRFSLLACGVALVGACASQPAATSLLDKKFERAARNYQTYQHEGQVVYCKRDKATLSNISEKQCFTEAQLRSEVESFERRRNTSIGTPIPAGAGQGSVGG